MGRNQYPAWSAAELATLRRIYPIEGGAGAAPALPGRSRRAIYLMAHKQGLTCSEAGRASNVRKGLAHYHALPSTKQRLAEQGRRLFDRRLSAAARAKSASPEARRKAGAAIRRTRMAWCPEAYWPLYRKLIDTDRLKAADARKAVTDQIAADEVRCQAAMTPFERQMARVAAGARIITKPRMARAEPAITLGGIGSAAL